MSRGISASPRARFRRPLTSADWVAIWVGLLALVAGILLLALTSGFVAAIVGACLIGVTGVAFIALLFLLVGEGEDRAYEHRKRAL